MNKPKYCYCCGRLNEHIKNECIQYGVITHEGHCRRLGNHEYFINDDEVYSSGNIEYCEYCGAKLNRDEDYIIGVEYHEFHGAPCSEELIIGYRCKSCGIEKRF